MDGVYTADPRIVPHARPLPHICYDEMLALSRLGVHVLHPRAVACAMQNRVPLIVRSSFHEADGTRITETRATRSAIPVSGIACMEHLVNVTLALTKREPTVVNRLTAVAAHSSLVRDKGTRELSFLIKREHAPKLSAMLSEFKGSVERVDYEYDKALLSVVGAEADNPDIVSTVEEQLHRASIKGKSVTTSRHSVSCLICQEDVMKAANALHQAFDLDKAKEACCKSRSFNSRPGDWARCSSQGPLHALDAPLLSPCFDHSMLTSEGGGHATPLKNSAWRFGCWRPFTGCDRKWRTSSFLFYWFNAENATVKKDAGRSLDQGHTQRAPLIYLLPAQGRFHPLRDQLQCTSRTTLLPLQG